jgi:hypothetical protein
MCCAFTRSESCRAAGCEWSKVATQPPPLVRPPRRVHAKSHHPPVLPPSSLHRPTAVPPRNPAAAVSATNPHCLRTNTERIPGKNKSYRTRNTGGGTVARHEQKLERTESTFYTTSVSWWAWPQGHHHRDTITGTGGATAVSQPRARRPTTTTSGRLDTPQSPPHALPNRCRQTRRRRHRHQHQRQPSRRQPCCPSWRPWPPPCPRWTSCDPPPRA